MLNVTIQTMHILYRINWDLPDLTFFAIRVVLVAIAMLPQVVTLGPAKVMIDMVV